MWHRKKFLAAIFTVLIALPLVGNAVEGSFEPFTGRVTNNRVRLRVEPNTDSTIVRESNRGEMFIIIGEDEDFYSIVPPKDSKAYVYRTFVMDNTIEGNRVNVRLGPTLESPVIAQLNSGDKIEGKLVPDNNRWYEIATPDTTRFYISKHYIENVGPADHLALLERRRKEADYLLTSAQTMAKEELNKPFEEVQLAEIHGYLDRICCDYPEFPTYTQEAQKCKAQVEHDFLQKKISFLEGKTARQGNQATGVAASSKIEKEIKVHQEKLQQVEQELQRHDEIAMEAQKPAQYPQNNIGTTPQMAMWHPAEENLYNEWLNRQESQEQTKEDFYRSQANEALELRGIIQPYRRSIKNKPGDYILVNNSNQMPIAYLYSTRINLQEKVGQDVALKVVRRPNNNFAFPAYFVLEIEQQ